MDLDLENLSQVESEKKNPLNRISPIVYKHQYPERKQTA